MPTKAGESRRSNAPAPPTGFPISRAGAIARQPPGLTARRASALILGWGALDEGENQASDGRREGGGTASEKFYWRPVVTACNKSLFNKDLRSSRESGFCPFLGSAIPFVVPF